MTARRGAHQFPLSIYGEGARGGKVNSPSPSMERGLGGEVRGLGHDVTSVKIEQYQHTFNQSFNMERIASFSVDHNVLTPGLYISRRDANVTTYDMRFKKPNTGDLLSNAEMHSCEHIMATLLRNSQHKDAIVYFGPMGCQTGFYFLFDNEKMTDAEAIELLRDTVKKGAIFDEPMPGKSPIECGNYINLDVKLANDCLSFYANIIESWRVDDLQYPKA